MRVVAYRGINRRGTHVMGNATVESVAAWIHAKHKAGWTDLNVYEGETEVGGIGPTGERYWWGES